MLTTWVDPSLFESLEYVRDPWYLKLIILHILVVQDYPKMVWSGYIAILDKVLSYVEPKLTVRVQDSSSTIDHLTEIG